MLINGEAKELISAFDRGLSYGDGLFETIAVLASEPLLWDLHYQRLKKGCRLLQLDCPASSRLKEQVDQEIGGRSQGVIKIILTRGEGARGYVYPSATNISVIVAFSIVPNYQKKFWEMGVAITLCQTPLTVNPILSGIKHLNRLEQVLARNEWQEAHFVEGLMKDSEGYCIEGTYSNVFILQGRTLITAPEHCLAVAGVMRQYVISCAESLGYVIKKARLSLDDLLSANMVFLTNALIGIWPVRQINQQILMFDYPNDLRDMLSLVSLEKIFVD